MIRSKESTGFTLIELMLAMSFVALLLIAIAGTTIQIMRIYTKGITLREVNQTGRTISEDIQRTVAAASPFEISQDESVSRYITRPGGGRLCTGTFTYAWNYGNTKELSGIDGKQAAFNTYDTGSDLIRLAKVTDVGGSLCAEPTNKVSKDYAKELVMAGDRSLAVQSFVVTKGASDDASGQALYAITFTLGTNNRAQLNTPGTYCLPSSQGDGSGDYCAITAFDVVVRSGNKAGRGQ